MSDICVVDVEVITQGNAVVDVIDVLPPTQIVEVDVSPIQVVEVGILQGPKGESGTMVVPVPFNEWPPVDPQENTLYLRLAM